MGRGRSGGRGGRGGRGGGRGKREPIYVDQSDKHNASFEEYYKTQDIVPEGEWDAFLACLRRPLPVTFRINGSGKFADHLRDKLQSDFFSHFSNINLTVDGEALQPPRPLAWYPNNYAWHMDFSRGQLRKLPLLEQIHEFMKKANDFGSISRQEAVSMVPPLFLDVQPQHKVLDMCAAPGSKTFQLLEALHSGPSTPTGFVVANDADFIRCNLLTHQTKRVCSPCLVVTNHSAEAFPLIQKPEGGYLRFDRILCDVPCSGDGTMRKAPDIWRRWNVNGGNGLHLLQLRIALQGCKLLEVGGLMVYSTCTFNPIEDEAVVAEVLVRCKGAIELVDVADHLPKLRRLPGKRSWRVRDKFRWYNSWEEAKEIGFKLDPTMFPSEEKAQLPLERCMRFLPHHQDTGGFFVCVLRKVGEVPEDMEMPTAKERSGASFIGGRAPAAGMDDAAAAAAMASITDPLEAARAAAQRAIEAAEAGVNALAGGNVEAAMAAAQEAAAAALAASHAQEVARRQAAAAARPAAAGAAAAAQGEAADGEEGAQGAGEEGLDEDAEAAAAAAAAAEGEAEEERPAAAEGEEQAAAGTSGDGSFKPSWVRGGGSRGRTFGGGRHKAIDPITPVEDPEVLKGISEYYGFKPDFPVSAHLIARSLETSKPKRLYFVTAPVMNLLLMDEQEQLKIVATGLKVFERQEMKGNNDGCSYRLAQEGLPFLLPHITRQRVHMGVAEFLALLKERFLMLPGAANAAGELPEEDARMQAAATRGAEGEAKGKTRRPIISDPALLAAIDAVQPGCLVCELKQEDAESLELTTGDETAGALTANAPMALSAWKGALSIAIMVDKAETTQMIDKIEGAKPEKKE